MLRNDRRLETTIGGKYSGSLVLQRCRRGLELEGFTFNLYVVLLSCPCPYFWRLGYQSMARGPDQRRELKKDYEPGRTNIQTAQSLQRFLHTYSVGVNAKLKGKFE